MSDSPHSAGSVASQNLLSKGSKGPPIFFLMMRLNIKVALLLLIIVGCLTIISLFSYCGGPVPYNKRSGKYDYNFDQAADVQGAEEIDCDINGEYTLPLGCRKEGEEVYVPFSFLHKYFEVYGKLATYDGLEKFEWSHSYSKIYYPKEKYNPRGVFMSFENYNVEVRDRVKCVSATEGVPISTQWEVQGYYYPTQIAQFGLSHYSKNLTEPEPRRKVVEDGEREIGNWFVPPSAKIERVFDKTTDSVVLNFWSSESFLDGITVKMDVVLDLVMSLDVMLGSNSSVIVTLQNRENKDLYHLHYLTSDTLIAAQANNIYHGLGTSSNWKKLIRDLPVDLQKGLSLLDKDKTKHRLHKSKLKVIAITLRGHGAIDNLTLSTSEHIQQFYNAAEWFVRHQDPTTGGWPIPARRRLASGFKDLQPGWYSAMGQGHALSVLSRAYHHSRGDQRYLDSALKGLRPFSLPSSGGKGVLARFMDKYPWYEEYPTQPALFVLNGFIYSLLGLYDLMVIAPEQAKEAERLFKEGMASLKAMLPLFDMGSVTSYDLRHFSLGIAPNLARWDYHATHVNQLLMLSTIESDPIFSQTAERWIGYKNGKRAAHN